MSILNKERADTICTMIALGFMADNPECKNFVYEKKNEDQHKKLQKFLSNNFGVEIVFHQCENKTAEPFIVAKKPRLEPEAAQNVNADLCYMAQMIESRVNTKAEIPLAGAYIGGMYDVSKLELLGPSDLWSYDPIYRNEVGAEVKQAYEKARVVSNELEKMLDDPPSLPKKIQYKHPGKKIIEGELEETKLFASVHGMIRSIFNYETDMKGVMLELALGKDTCKVASCIPCALFMEAVNMPASAIHLGRGDNWNFPEGKKSSSKYRDWRTKIIFWLEKGMTICNKNKNTSNITDRIAACKLNYDVSEIFLEALTYESSFIDKMCTTFGI